MPCSLSEIPRLTLVAISGSAKPVALDRKGTVLEDLGFTVGGSVKVVAALNGSLIVKVRETRVAISDGMARRSMV